MDMSHMKAIVDDLLVGTELKSYVGMGVDEPDKILTTITLYTSGDGQSSMGMYCYPDICPEDYTIKMQSILDKFGDKNKEMTDTLLQGIFGNMMYYGQSMYLDRERSDIS
jgi:hypothetical protein